MIAGIYLAAGKGERFGGDKLLHVVGGKPLFSYGLEQCIASRLEEIHVVVGPETAGVESEVARRYGDEPKIHVDLNEGAAGGMMSSLKTGIRQIADGYDAAMVLLADMPLVTAIMIDELIGTFETHASIVIPECGGELRHPRVIPRRLFPEFLELADDEKGTKVIERHRRDVVRLSIGNELNYIDIDTTQDLGALENL